MDATIGSPGRVGAPREQTRRAGKVSGNDTPAQGSSASARNEDLLEDSTFMTGMCHSLNELSLDPENSAGAGGGERQGDSGSPSLISSSENPLHSPSATDEDVADDLFSAADQLDGTIGWESVGSGGDPNGNSGLFGDSLYSQNPINSPSSSPAGSPRTSAEVPESNVGRFDNKALDQAMEEQQLRRSELEDYMGQLVTKTDEDGEPSVAMPMNFSSLVQELFQDSKPKEGEKDWLTVAREEAAAAAEAASANKASWMSMKTGDEKTQAALEEAVVLDKKLREKQIEAMIVKREVYPEKWEEEKARRNSRMKKKAEEGIKAERKRRQHQARVQRALKVIEGVEQDDHLRRNAHQGPRARYFMLTDQEEELVEKLLKNTSDDVESSSNPFELQIVPINGDGGDGDNGFDLARDTVKQLSDIESKLSNLAQDHMFDEAGSIVDFRSSHAAEWSSHNGASSHRPGSASTTRTDVPPSVVGSEAPRGGVAAAPAPPSSQASTRAGRPMESKAPSNAPSSKPAKSVVSENSRTVEDYLTQQRLAKEAARREMELDDRIRQLRTSEIPLPRNLATGEIDALIQHCKRAHEACEARIDAINRMTDGMLSDEPANNQEKHLSAPRSQPGSRRASSSGSRATTPSVSQSDHAIRKTSSSGSVERHSSSQERVDAAVVGPSARPSSTTRPPSAGRRPRSGTTTISDRPSSVGTGRLSGAASTAPLDRPPSFGRAHAAADGKQTSAVADGVVSGPSSRPRTPSANGPTRPASQRQRRPSDGISVADVVASSAQSPKVIFHAHNNNSGKDKPPPGTPPKSGRRSHSGPAPAAVGVSSTSSSAVDFDGLFVSQRSSTPPTPSATNSLELLEVGGQQMKRVPSAGRRAGLKPVV